MKNDNTNYGFGPISVPREKKRVIQAKLCVIIVASTLLVICRSIMDTPVVSYSDVRVFTAIVSTLIICELIRRCCLFAEEYQHTNDRYGGSWIDAMKACLSLSCGIAEIGMVFLLSTGYTLKSWWTRNEPSTFPVILFVVIKLAASVASKMVDMKRLSNTEISEIIECDPRNVAEGLAWAYYYNYLKVVLPVFGNMLQQATGEKFQLDGGDICDKVTDERLYVIIPKDGYCYKSFDEVDDRLRPVPKQLPVIGKAGDGSKRTYNLSLYEVSTACMSSSKYVVMEYALPLITLYDMSLSAKVNFTEENRSQQVIQFYNILKRILAEDHECQSKCNLVLTGPGSGRVSSRKKNLADTIYEQIKE